MKSSMKFMYLFVGMLWAHNGNTSLTQVAKLAALQTRAVYLMNIMAKEYAHKDASAHSVSLQMVNPQSKYAPASMRNGTVMGRTSFNFDELKAYIILNTNLKDASPAQQTHAILHELAHAYDPYLEHVLDIYDGFNVCNPQFGRDAFTYYPYLREDAHECIEKLKAKGNRMAGLQILSYEWYADWKAMNVTLRKLPGEARALRSEYRGHIDNGLERFDTPRYPPLEILVKWLSQKPSDR